MQTFFKKLNFEQKVVLLLVILFMAFIPLIALSPYFQGSPTTYKSSASEVMMPEPTVEIIEDETPILPEERQEESISSNLNISASQRSVGKIQELTEGLLTIVVFNDSLENYLLDEQVVYLRKVPLPVEPDEDGLVPLTEQQLSFSDLSTGMEVEVAWEEIEGQRRTLLVNVL